MQRARAIAAAVTLLGAGAASAQQGTVSGSVVDGGGAPLGGIEIRLHDAAAFWAKAPSLRASATTLGDGTWSVVTDPGDYYVIARDPNGAWVDELWSDAQVAEAAAVATLPAAGAVPGIDFSLAPASRLEGQVFDTGGVPLNGLHVYCHSSDEPRLAHLETSHWNGADGYFQCGGLPPQTFRTYAYDPSGAYQVVELAPVALAPGQVAGGLGIPLPAMPADPHEPSDRGAPFPITLPFTSVGAALGQNDVDAYAFDAVGNERIGVVTQGPVAGCTVDPLVAILDAGGGIVAIDDDSGGTLQASLEATLPGPGRYTVVVTSYPDTDLDGLGGARLGAYTVTIQQRNGAPTIEVRDAGGAAVVEATVPEGGHLELFASAVDPEGDPVTLSSDPLPANASFDPATGRFVFDPDHSQSVGSPYAIALHASDPFSRGTATVLVHVTDVNRPPGAPAITTPGADGERVTSPRPQIVAGPAVDPDGDVLTYRFVLDDSADLSSPDAVVVAGVAEGPPGAVLFVPPSDLLENTVYWVSVAASDGRDTGPEARRSFVVDVTNEPPPAPRILRPVMDERLLDPDVAFAIENVVDPDGEAVTYDLQVAIDEAFAAPVASESGIAEGAGETVTNLPQPLATGRTYFVRARAVDARQLRSGWSEPVRFSVGEDVPDGGEGGGGQGGGGAGGSDGGDTGSGGVPVAAPPPPDAAAPEDGCGCSGGGDARGLGLVLGLLAVALLRVRRASPRCRVG